MLPRLCPQLPVSELAKPGHPVQCSGGTGCPVCSRWGRSLWPRVVAEPLRCGPHSREIGLSSRLVVIRCKWECHRGQRAWVLGAVSSALVLQCLTGRPRACLRSGVPAAADTSARAVPGHLVRAAAGLRSPPQLVPVHVSHSGFSGEEMGVTAALHFAHQILCFLHRVSCPKPIRVYTHMQAHSCTLTHRCTHTDFPLRSPLPSGSEWMGHLLWTARWPLCVLSCAGSSLPCTGFL